MAKFKKGILGPIEGKLGPVVGSSWKGIPYLKTAQKKAGARTPSKAQIAHHQKFTYLTRWLRPLHSFLLAGFRNLAISNTQLNIAFSYNFAHAVKGEAPDFFIDYANARISLGNMLGMDEPQLTLIDANTIRLQWQNIDHKLSVYNDQLMLVLYNDEIGLADGFVGGIKRNAKSCTFTFDQKLVSQPFHVFVGFIGLDGGEISDSQYLGKIEAL